MTCAELAAILLETPSLPIVAQFRMKTGYDEGDIYNGSITETKIRDDEMVLIMGQHTRVGGW